MFAVFSGEQHIMGNDLAKLEANWSRQKTSFLDANQDKVCG